MKLTSDYRVEKYDSPITFAVKHKDYETRMASRSGGIFTALSDYILNKNGVVYGCILDENFVAVHIRADNIDKRNLMRGSKYVQSEMQDIFHSVKKDLIDGRQVLFSGTSCQIAGLLRYLEDDYSNLFCVDIVCHGVPSPLVWRDYLQWQEKKNNSKVIGVDFRNKIDFGWNDHVESLFFQNGQRKDYRYFTTLFYGHSILRPCCYKCPYKDIIHPGNITIADYWGIDQAAPGFNDNKGVSLVLVNDDKGKKLFIACDNDLEIRQTHIEDSMQPPLEKSFPMPVERSNVWNYYIDKPYNRFINKYAKIKLYAKAKRKIKVVLKKVMSLIVK